MEVYPADVYKQTFTFRRLPSLYKVYEESQLIWVTLLKKVILFDISARNSIFFFNSI